MLLHGINDDLLKEAVRLGRRKARREIVHDALREYIQRRKRLQLARYFGGVDFHTGWSYKKNRRLR